MNHYVKVYNPTLQTEFYIIIKDLNEMNNGTIINVIHNMNEPHLVLGYHWDFFNIKFCSLVTDPNTITMLNKLMVFQ